jgi:glutamate/tyrosine decarboxylase-like PLP-dependent enzyme
MDETLARDLKQLDSLLEKALEQSRRFLAGIEQRPPAVSASARPLLELPAAGLGAGRVLELFTEHYEAQMGASAGPRYFGFVTGGTTPAALVGDWLVSALDQNVSHPGSSAAPLVELETLGLFRQLLGLPESFSGSFVSGATLSNFVGLATARQWVARRRGVDVSAEGLYALKPIPVLCAVPHSSALKSLSMLGMGRNSLQRVPCLPGRECVDAGALEAQLQALGGEPCIVLASAGTVNTGDFDDLEAVARLRERYPFWLHVDGAFGALVACSPELAHLTRGLEQADSITVDAHKWLNVPYDSAIQLTRHPELVNEVFRNSAAYLGGAGSLVPFADLGPENSRRFRALPAWFTLLAYGRQGYREIIERCCRLARRLGEHLQGSGAFRLLAPVRLNIVCFTLVQPGGNPSLEQVQALLGRVKEDGRVFLTQTVYDGVPGIRAALSNWRTTEADLDLAATALREVARAMVGGSSTS